MIVQLNEQSLPIINGKGKILLKFLGTVEERSVRILTTQSRVFVGVSSAIWRSQGTCSNSSHRKFSSDIFVVVKFLVSTVLFVGKFPDYLFQLRDTDWILASLTTKLGLASTLVMKMECRYHHLSGYVYSLPQPCFTKCIPVLCQDELTRLEIPYLWTVFLYCFCCIYMTNVKSSLSDYPRT